MMTDTLSALIFAARLIEILIQQFFLPLLPLLALKIRISYYTV